MSDITKACPVCCESINQRARKCPHCQQWQGRLHTIVMHPAFGMLLVVIPLGVIYLFGASLAYRATHVERRDFSQHRSRFTVLSSQVSFYGPPEQQRVMTVGTLRNDSRYPWADVEMDVKYFDANGVLIDVGSELGTRTVAAGGEIAFAITSAAHQPSETYAAHEVAVRWAEEPDRWPF